jgi:hypothetical protein
VNNPYARLSERIHGEATDLDRIVQRALSAWVRLKSEPEQMDVCLDSVALNLHAFYSGIERLFELIARDIDQCVPAGEMWHRDLIKQMTKEINGVRPAVVNPIRISSLDSLRRFRHLVRNIYSFNLVPERVEPLISELPALWSILQKELIAFGDFLAALALETDSP